MRPSHHGYDIATSFVTSCRRNKLQHHGYDIATSNVTSRHHSKLKHLPWEQVHLAFICETVRC